MVLPARLRRWLRWGSQPPASQSPSQDDPLLVAGRSVRQRREARGLTLRELALETRISTPVLEALERGWRERLPEPAYLRTMLPLIERHLELEPRSLEALLPPAGAQAPGYRHGSLRRRFTPGSIEVFSSWQGTVLYGLLTLGVIYALNLEQQRLAAEGLLAVRPIPPLPMHEQHQPARPELGLLAAFPELRPLDQQALETTLRLVGQPTNQTQAALPQAAVDSDGLLVLRLQQPTRVTLSSGRGARTDLQGARGDLVLPIEGGFQLQLDPPPASGAEAPGVEWNGAALPPLPGPPAGRYAVAAGPRPRP